MSTELHLTIYCADGHRSVHETIDTINMALLRLAELKVVDDTEDRGWMWAELQPHHVFRIIALNEVDDDGKPLYWNNTLGWVAEGREELFSYADLLTANLPIDGAWVPAV